MSFIRHMILYILCMDCLQGPERLVGMSGTDDLAPAVPTAPCAQVCDIASSWYSASDHAYRLAGDLPVHFTKDKDGWGVRKGSVAQMMRRSAATI